MPGGGREQRPTIPTARHILQTNSKLSDLALLNNNNNNNNITRARSYSSLLIDKRHGLGSVTPHVGEQLYPWSIYRYYTVQFDKSHNANGHF